jgi:multisubunit Na+/H+ antiporter MnhG subunit
MTRSTPTRAIVLTTIGAFVLFMSVLGLFEAQHTSAKIFYSITAPAALVLLGYQLRNRRRRA